MPSSPLKVSLLGHGYWGRNFARNIVSHPDLELISVADPSPPSLATATSLYPGVRGYSDAADAISSPGIDIVVIATPLNTHFELTKKALQAGLHVVVTKPLASSVREADELVEIARKNELVLLVDNTFVYTNAVQKMRELMRAGTLGEPIYCSSTRVNLGTYRRDSSVLWDLAPHDISILDAVGYGTPTAVAATGGGRMGGPMDQIAHLTLYFQRGYLALINVSWLAPVKMRFTIFGGTEKMIVYNDVEPSEKIKIYDKGVRLDSDEASGSLRKEPEYRLGDMWAPHLDSTEALFSELTHLVTCISNGTEPLTGAESGAAAVRILTAATDSARRGGEMIILDHGHWDGSVTTELRHPMA